MSDFELFSEVVKFTTIMLKLVVTLHFYCILIKNAWVKNVKYKSQPVPLD